MLDENWKGERKLISFFSLLSSVADVLMHHKMKENWIEYKTGREMSQINNKNCAQWKHFFFSIKI